MQDPRVSPKGTMHQNLESINRCKLECLKHLNVCKFETLHKVIACVTHSNIPTLPMSKHFKDYYDDAFKRSDGSKTQSSVDWKCFNCHTAQECQSMDVWLFECVVLWRIGRIQSSNIWILWIYETFESLIRWMSECLRFLWNQCKWTTINTNYQNT